jgi:hypothetical protein
MSADGWYPAARNDIAHGGGAGPFTSLVTVGCLHTTESPPGKYRPSDHDYGGFGHTNYPHFTADVQVVGGKRTFICWQHISIREAAKALKNRAGGVETNREGVIQIEVVGSATHDFTDDPVMVEGLKRLMRWIESQTDIPRESTVTFKAYPGSYGINNGVRLGNRAWGFYAGWLGHQHVPENEHGDPGPIAIKLLLEVTKPAVKPAPVPAPAPAPEPPQHKEIDMLIVLAADGQTQYVCDAKTKRHITQNDRAVLVAAGVPYVGPNVPVAARSEFLTHLSEVPA